MRQLLRLPFLFLLCICTLPVFAGMQGTLEQGATISTYKPAELSVPVDVLYVSAQTKINSDKTNTSNVELGGVQVFASMPVVMSKTVYRVYSQGTDSKQRFCLYERILRFLPT